MTLTERAARYAILTDVEVLWKDRQAHLQSWSRPENAGKHPLILEDGIPLPVSLINIVRATELTSDYWRYGLLMLRAF